VDQGFESPKASIGAGRTESFTRHSGSRPPRDETFEGKETEMRATHALALGLALTALVPIAAQAQVDPRFGGIPMFSQPFQYSDREGPGTLTITPLSDASTRLSYQPIRVTLDQSGRHYVGAGAYHAFSDDGADLPPFALVSFTLESASGRSYFFQGRIAPVNGYTGEGTYYPIDAPQAAVTWRIQTAAVTESLVNATPALVDYWSRLTFAEAVGGVYWATYNTLQGAVSRATWSGTLPASGNYRVEVFIPRQVGTGMVPRTNRAVYQIATGGPAGQVLRTVNQQVGSSQWIDLGTFSFTGSYRIVLTDETGEPRATRSVVANAVRLTPVTSGL
jgi:hypothetical protein